MTKTVKPNKTYTDTIMELLDYLSRQKDKKAAELYQKVGKLWDMIEEVWRREDGKKEE